jgi:hypothetical protein
MIRFTSPVPGKIVARRCYPSEVGWARNLYIAPEPDQNKAQFLELQMFSVIDDGAAKALLTLNTPGLTVVPHDQAVAWTLFIKSLFFRTPAYLAATKEGGERLHQDTMRRLRHEYSSLRQPHDPPTFEEYEAAEGATSAELSTLRILPGLIANRATLDALMGLHWVMVNVPAECHDLLLSDDPIARTNGLKTTGGHIAMPLSPRRLLIGAWEKEFAKSLRNTQPKELVRGMNTWLVESARHFVAATDYSQELFIRNRFGRNPKPGILANKAPRA